MLTIAATLALLWLGTVPLVALAFRELFQLLDQHGASIVAALNAAEPSTDADLLARIEVAERRVDSIHQDVTKTYRKTAQERRRIEAAAGSEDDDEDQTPADLARLAQRSLAFTNGEREQVHSPPTARPRLRPRQR